MTAGWDLRRWIVDEHESVLARFDRSVASIVPHDRWRDPAGAGGSSIAWLLLHTAYHQDVAINTVVGAGEPLMTHWRGPLGLARLAPHIGLGEAEDTVLTDAVDIDALDAYMREVHLHSAACLEGLDPAMLEAVPASSEALTAAGITGTDVPWLHSMWADQPVAFYVRWEATGHRMQHVGEMVSVRNRLGLSPF